MRRNPVEELPMRIVVIALLMNWSVLSNAADLADLSQPHILVATPALNHTLFGAGILVVKPIGGDQHVGFIVNRPTGVTLGAALPDHATTQKTAEPVYLGGPVESELVFALVRRPDRPEGDSVEVLPGLYAVFDTSA